MLSNFIFSLNLLFFLISAMEVIFMSVHTVCARSLFLTEFLEIMGWFIVSCCQNQNIQVILLLFYDRLVSASGFARIIPGLNYYRNL